MASEFPFGSVSLGAVRRVLCITAATCAAGFAQELMPPSGGVVRLFPSDAAVLESSDIRKDLPCTVDPIKPVLGFDLKFHSGFDITIPLKELAGPENLLSTVFRVTPEGHPDQPVYFSQRTVVPTIEEDAKGNAYLEGKFDVGEGKYHVAWLMRDRAEKVCSFNWDFEAALPVKDKDIALDIGSGVAQPADSEPFKPEGPVQRETRGQPLNVKVMINFAPRDAASATFQPLDTGALVSILRSVARDPRISRFSIVAFNMQEQRVIYRQREASQIDFPALGEALKTLNLGTIDLKLLGQKHGDTEFLANLITSEIAEDPDQPDAVIVAGPKVTLDGNVPGDALRQVGDLKFPLFYMNFNPDPQANPWRDSIGTAIKSLKGAEFTITRPRDLFYAWAEIIGRIVKSKFGGTTASAAAASSQ